MQPLPLPPVTDLRLPKFDAQPKTFCIKSSKVQQWNETMKPRPIEPSKTKEISNIKSSAWREWTGCTARRADRVTSILHIYCLKLRAQTFSTSHASRCVRCIQKTTSVDSAKWKNLKVILTIRTPSVNQSLNFPAALPSPSWSSSSAASEWSSMLPSGPWQLWSCCCTASQPCKAKVGVAFHYLPPRF